MTQHYCSEVSHVPTSGESSLIDQSLIDDAVHRIESTAIEPLQLSSMSASRASPELSVHRVLGRVENLQSVHYMMKNIVFNDCDRSIVCQTTNGACPILSVANYLSLSSLLDLPRNQKQISAAALTDILGDYLLTHSHNLSFLAHLEGLHRGLNVNPDFRGVDRFGDAPDIIQAFGAQLVHGWIPAGDDQAYSLLTGECLSYPTMSPVTDRSFTNFEVAQVQILTEPDSTESMLINDFLSNHPNNMTAAGLKQLEYHMKDGELSILFYNSHFSLLYKHPGSDRIFTLVTDAGYLEAGNHVVWESLTLNGNTQYFSAEFIPHTLINEAIDSDNYGKHQSRSTASEDEALARKLDAEEHGLDHAFIADSDLARNLQDIENRTASNRQEQKVRQRIEQNQRRPEQNNVPSVVDPAEQRTSKNTGKSLHSKPPKVRAERVPADMATGTSKKSKECIIM